MSGRIRVSGPGGRVVYEGEGEIRLDRPFEAVTLVAYVRRDGLTVGGAQVDLTEVCRCWPYTLVTETRLPEVADEADVRTGTPELPRVVELTLEAPDWMTQHITAELQHHLGRVERAAGPGPSTPWERLLNEGRAAAVPADVAETLTDDLGRLIPGMRRAGEAAAEVTEAFQRLAETCSESEGPVGEYDELIAQTRAEFPPDPYDYGQQHPSGPHRWTPPEDPDERIPSCPA